MMLFLLEIPSISSPSNYLRKNPLIRENVQLGTSIMRYNELKSSNLMAASVQTPYLPFCVIQWKIEDSQRNTRPGTNYSVEMIK